VTTLEELEAQLRQAVLEVIRLENLGGTTSPELERAREVLREIEEKVAAKKVR
jgi:hypothetical protein